MGISGSRVMKKQAEKFDIIEIDNDKSESIKTDPDKVLMNYDESFSLMPIFRGICEGKTSSVLSCLKGGDDGNIICKNTGHSYLHLIMKIASPMNETKFVPFVYQLSNANVNLDLQDKEGFTPLRLAIKGRLLDLMVALIKCGATCIPEEDEAFLAAWCGSLSSEFRSEYLKFAPGFWLPVEENKVFKVSVLVKSWCRINISRNGMSLVEFAKQKNADEKIVQMLITNEASIEFAHATIAGDEETMQNFLSHQTVDLTIKDMSHRKSSLEPRESLTLHDAAVKYGHKHVLSLLRDSKIKDN